MLNYYEDTMPLQTNQDEYLKYYIDESLPLFDKFNIIIKKGQTFQRQALLTNLNIYVKNSLFQPLIQFIIAEIETWDTDTIILFPKSLYILLTKELSSIDNELFNIIFGHMINIIASGNEKLSIEYIKYYDLIIEYYTKIFNNENSFPFIINDDICEKIFVLGKFGQNLLNRKLCCYLSSSICRLIRNINNENCQKLYNRIYFLFCDSEKTTETQMSRELKYLLPIFNKDMNKNKDILEAIKSYLNHDSDHVIQATTILSLLNNMNFINEEIKELLIEKINEVIDDDNYENEYKDQMIEVVINYIYNEYYKNNNGNNLESCNNDINKFKFIGEYLMKEKINLLGINNFDKISVIIKNNNLYINNEDEEKITIDDVFIKIYNSVFTKNSDNNADIFYKKNELEDNLNSSNLVKNGADKEQMKKLFYQNLPKILKSVNNFVSNKYIYEKFNNLFKKDLIITVLKYYEISTNTNKKIDKKDNILYQVLFTLLNLSNNYTNDYYFKLFQNIISNIINYYKYSSDLLRSENHFLIAKTLQKIIKHIYKFFKSTCGNIKEKEKISADKIYDEIFSNLLSKVLLDQKLGNHIKIEYINIFPHLILYGNNRNNYINFIEDEILKSVYFYTRRYSINYLNKCFEVFSINSLIKFGFIDYIFLLINDDNNIISACIINLIFKYRKKIAIYSPNTIQKIIKTLTKINKLNKDNQLVKNFDVEKNRIIKKFLIFKLEDEENEDETLEIKEKEKKLISRETEILGKINFSQSPDKISKPNSRMNSNFVYNNNSVIRNDETIKNESKNTKFSFTQQKEKMKNKKSWIEKSGSMGVIYNVNNSKKVLPKINHSSIRNNLSMKDKDLKNDMTISNTNKVHKFHNNSNNKLIICIKDKDKEISPMKNVIKLKSSSCLIRLPSANEHKSRKSLPLCFSSKNNNNFLVNIKNLYNEEKEYRTINIKDINNGSTINNNKKYLNNGSKIIMNDIINGNDTQSNSIQCVKNNNNNNKNFSITYRVNSKNIKLKKDNYFNISNRIFINANINK